MKSWIGRLVLAIWFVGMVVVAVRGTPAQGQAEAVGGFKQYLPLLTEQTLLQLNPPFRDYIALGVTDRNADEEIYTIRGDGSDLRQLTSNEWIDTTPHFSPDGSLIAFVQRDSPGDATTRPMVMNRDGSDMRPLLEGIPANQVYFRWSPDGQRLLVSLWQDTAVPTTYLYMVSLDGTITELYSGFGEQGSLLFGWSPDGRYIHYVSNFASQISTLSVVPTYGGVAKQLISAQLYSLAWHPDSQELLVLVVENNIGVQGRLISPDGSTDRVVFEGDYRFIDWVQNRNLMLLQGLLDSKLVTVPRNGGPLNPLTTDSIQLGGVDSTGTGVLYMSRALTDTTVYWNTFDGSEPQELLSFDEASGLVPGAPSLAQDRSGLLFPIYDFGERLGYTFLYYANLHDSDTTQVVDKSGGLFVRFLPFSSQRAVLEIGTGGYPPPRYAMPNMVDVQSGTAERLPFPDDLFLVSEWRYMP